MWSYISEEESPVVADYWHMAGPLLRHLPVSVKTSFVAPHPGRKEEGDEQSHQEQGTSAELHATTAPQTQPMSVPPAWPIAKQCYDLQHVQLPPEFGSQVSPECWQWLLMYCPGFPLKTHLTVS